jgi:hypothetical protein
VGVHEKLHAGGLVDASCGDGDSVLHHGEWTAWPLPGPNSTLVKCS